MVQAATQRLDEELQLVASQTGDAHVLEADRVFDAVAAKARRLKPDLANPDHTGPHIANWDVIAGCSSLTEDELAPRLVRFSDRYCGKPSRARQDIRRVRHKLQLPDWKRRQGQRTVDVLTFLAMQEGRVSVSYAAAFLKLGEPAIRKAVRERCQGRLALDGKGFVVLVRTEKTTFERPTSTHFEHVTTPRRPIRSVRSDSQVTCKKRVRRDARTSVLEFRDRVTIQTESVKATAVAEPVSKRKRILTTAELLALLNPARKTGG